MREERIDHLRRACGTLPNRSTIEKTKIYYGCEILKVELIDGPVNPYKAIFAMTTSTWGDDFYESKWGKVRPMDRFRVVLAALRGKTLPTGIEAPKYTFRVVGLPRHCFDQMARTRIGAGFGSSGCRDNSKADASFILYSEYKEMSLDKKRILKNHLLHVKAIYTSIIKEGEGSYQMARSFLPMCYHHPFHFTQSLLSLISQSKRRMCFAEEEFISGLHWYIREMFRGKGMKLVANFMFPACDRVGGCLYSQKGENEFFSNLFRGCGRHPSNSNYSEFNKTCSDRSSLESQMNILIPKPTEYTNFSVDEEHYNMLGSKDQFYFEED